MRRLLAIGTALLLALGSLLLPVADGRPAAAQIDDLVYGVIVDTTNPLSMRLAREAGFTHAKMVLFWPRLQPDPTGPLWRETTENDLDNVMKAAGAQDLQLVLRVDAVPDWAGGSPGTADPDAVETFYAEMARYGRGRVAAYEILNEPNLPYEWGGPPDPTGYTRFLRAAYRGIKAGDPSALVIGGGPAPNTGGLGGTIEDFEFIEGMYLAGARGYMDALGVHNFGGNVEPGRDPSTCGICFRRAELYRELMVGYGDAATPMWATEYGYLYDPGYDLGQYDWLRLSAQQQAEYVVESFRYAEQNWPWMQGLLLNNLDASTSPYHTHPLDGMPWFALLNADHSPRPSYEAFKQLRAEQRTDVARRRPAADPAAVAVAPPSAVEGPAAGGVASEEGAVSEEGPVSEEGATSAAEPSPAEAVASEAGTEADPAERETPSSAPTASVQVVNTDGLGVSLRAEPGARAPRVTVAPEGAILQVVGPDRQAEGRTWRNVQLVGGPSGWVAAEYLTTPDDRRRR